MSDWAWEPVLHLGTEAYACVALGYVITLRWTDVGRTQWTYLVTGPRSRHEGSAGDTLDEAKRTVEHVVAAVALAAIGTSRSLRSPPDQAIAETIALLREDREVLRRAFGLGPRVATGTAFARFVAMALPTAKVSFDSTTHQLDVVTDTRHVVLSQHEGSWDCWRTMETILGPMEALEYLGAV